MGAGSKLMPLTQQPSFEAVKTLDVTPSTRAGNTKTLSYLVRLVLYTEPPGVHHNKFDVGCERTEEREGRRKKEGREKREKGWRGGAKVGPKGAGKAGRPRARR